MNNTTTLVSAVSSSDSGQSSALSYKFLVEAFLMPAVSALGLAGNTLSLYILSRREVKLKRDFVEILCSLATFDNLLLVRAPSDYVTNIWHQQKCSLLRECSAF